MKTAAFALALLAAGGPAPAQYRAGVPDVLTPPPAPPTALESAAASFRACYARRGRPRIILFWNRVLSDEVQSRYADRLTATRTEHEGAVAGRIGRTGFAAAADHERLDIARTTDRIREGARDSMAEPADWQVETAFNRAFIDNGAVFVDRSVAMRVTGHGRDLGATPNVQDIETGALIGKADLLMEVLQTPDPGSPLGYVFRADVKDVRTGQIIATAVSNGREAASAPGRLVPGPRGFVREAPQPITLEDAGRTLAADVMGILAARWAG